MSATVVGSVLNWSSSQTPDGQREYKVKFRVKTDSPNDGPNTVREATGLPVNGSIWSFGDDIDPWAFCLSTDDIKPDQSHSEDDLFRYWIIEKTFATPGHPNFDVRRCNDTKIENPLLEPPKVSGGSSKHSIEATHDRFGFPIVSSSWEQFRGQQNEWDDSRSTVRIEINVPTFAQVALALGMRDSVNRFPLWGFQSRCVKLSTVTWEQKYYGACFVYYTLVLDFDTNVETFDRYLLDEGNRIINGHWDGEDGSWVVDRIGADANARWPNRANPADFIQATDRQGNPMRAVLNGFGLPAGVHVCLPVVSIDELNRYFPGSNPYQPYLVQHDSDTPYISVIDDTVNPGDPPEQANLDNPLCNTRRWLKIANWEEWSDDLVNPEPPQVEHEAQHSVGDVVREVAREVDGVAVEAYWICIANTGDSPSFDSTSWVIIRTYTPADETPPQDKGVYNRETTYIQGDYVTPLPPPEAFVGTAPTCFDTTIGYRYVQKYNEANFLLLGIPVFF